MDKNKKKNKNIAHYIHTSLSLIIFLAILIVINLVSQKINFKVDLSENKLYTLTEKSIEVLDRNKEKIEIYALFPQGYELDILDEYPKNYPNITLVYKDLNYFPSFAKQVLGSETEVYPGSIIVKSEKRSRIILPENLQTETTTNIEYEVTNAIQYVCDDEINKKILYISDHGELKMPTEYLDAFDKNGFYFEEISLSTLDEIPPEATSIILTLPTIDYSVKEAEVIKKYLNDGGNALFIVDHSVNNFENLSNIILEQGVEVYDGFIYEGDSNFSVTQDRLGFFTTPTEHEMIYELLLRLQIGPIMLMSSPLIDVSNDDSKQISSLIVTSDKSYAKSLDKEASTFEKEDGDLEGPFSVGVIIEQNNPDLQAEYKGKSIILSSIVFLDEDFSSSYSSDRNANYLLQLIANISSTVASENIPIKSLLPNESFILTESQTNSIQLTVIVFIPLAFILIGAFIFLKRRHA